MLPPGRSQPQERRRYLKVLQPLRAPCTPKMAAESSLPTSWWLPVRTVLGRSGRPGWQSALLRWALPSSPALSWARGHKGCTDARRCGGGFCPHLGRPTCALDQWLLISSSAPGLQNLWTLRLPRGCGRFPGCPHCLWAAPITPTSLPTMKCPLRFSTQSRFPPTLHWGKAVKGFCKLFSRFQKAQRKSYTYLNEVPRLNKTLSLFALGWSHINSVW